MTSNLVTKKRYVDTSRGQLHYRQCGDGEPIVFLHILPFASLMFDPVLPHFASLGYACFAFDLMGYGRSDKLNEEWLVEDYTDNLEEAFVSLDIQSPRLVGGHLGGLVCVDLAKRLGTTPQLVLDGVPLWSREQQKERFSKNPVPEPVKEDGSTVLKAWNQIQGALKNMDPQAVFDVSTEASFMDAFIAMIEMQYKPGKAKAFFSYDTLNELQSISTPTLVIGSETDSLSGYHDGAVEIIPNCSSHFFDGVHPLYKMTRNRDGQDLEDYVQLLTDFFKTKSAGHAIGSS